MTKTILMIHGFGCAGDCWGPVAERFRSAGYAVETPTIQADLRTVGPPPAGLIGKTLADYVTEMSALAASIAKRDGEKPLVFGHSMGGLISQKLAEAGLVSGLVLFSPASPADARGKPKLSPVFTFLNIALSPKPEARTVRMWKTGFKWGVLNQTPEALHEAIYAKAVHDSGRVLADLAYPDRDANRTAHVDAGKVTVPILVIAGARDRTTPVEDLRLVGKKYAQAVYREYPDNAHWIIDEPGSAAILDEAAAWLDANGLGVKTAPAAKAAPKPAPVKAEAAKPVETPPTPKSKPAPKAAAKAAAKTKAPAPAPAPAAKAPVVKDAAKAKAPTPAKPAASKAKPVAAAPAKAPAKPKVAATAAAPAKVAPKAKTAPAAKPAAAKAAAPKAKAAAAAKPPATPKPAKTSPRPKKTV